MRLSRSSSFALRLRIPAWAVGATLRINQEPLAITPKQGFATVARTWRDGDRIDLRFPLTPRLEPVDESHPTTVALMRGPLQLFGVASEPPPLSKSELLGIAPRPDGASWWAQTSRGPLEFRPFFGIRDEPYRSYFHLA